MKRTIQVVVRAALVLMVVSIGVWGWRHWQSPWNQPRYSGKPISGWFPHWWRNRPPAPPSSYNGPTQAGPEAVPFLTQELDLEDLPSHRAHAWLSQYVPARWMQALPQPYPPQHHRPAIKLWLKHIVRTPGGPTAIATAVQSSGSISKRRLLYTLGDAQAELSAVIPVLAGALQDPDPAIRRVAGRSLLRLPVREVESVLTALLGTIASDTGTDGQTAWSPQLARLVEFEGHEHEIRAALQPWVDRRVPEALSVVAELDRKKARP